MERYLRKKGDDWQDRRPRCWNCGSVLVSAKSRKRGVCARCDPGYLPLHPIPPGRPRSERKGGRPKGLPNVLPVDAPYFWRHNRTDEPRRPCPNRWVARDTPCSTCGHFRLNDDMDGTPDPLAQARGRPGVRG